MDRRNRKIALELYKPEKAANLLGMARKTLLDRLRSGDVDGFKIGNCWRIRGSEIERLLKKSNLGQYAYDENDSLLTTQDVARYLQITPERVRYLLRARKLCGFKLFGKNSHWKICRFALERHIEDGNKADHQ